MNTQPQNGSLNDYLNGEDLSNKIFTFTIIGTNLNPSIQTSDGQPMTRRPTDRIQAFSLIREKTKDNKWNQRKIRYIPGESSIYSDEQSTDPEIVNKKYYIVFVNGRKVVSGQDSLLLKYMMMDNLNESNPNRIESEIYPMYRLIDTAKIIETRMANDELLDDAKHFARKGEWDEVEAYARVLNLNMNRSSAEIRYDLRGLAEIDPKKFLDDLKNPLMRKKHYVLKAVDEGYLVINKSNNSIAWANNPNNPLDVAALGKDIIDSFVRKLTTEDGKLIYLTIVDMLKPVDEPAIKMAALSKEEIENLKATVKPVASLKISEESDEELLALVDEAVIKGLVTFKMPMWYEYSTVSFKKKEGLVTALKSDSNLLNRFKKDLLNKRGE